MKKFITASAAITLLTMAGCSSSVALADTLEVTTVALQEHKKPVTSDARLIETVKQKNLLEEQQARVFKLEANRQKINTMIKRLKKTTGKTRYVFSGSTPSGWDCSGMVLWAYKQLGIHLEHSATKQGHSGKRVKNPKVGDIVVFGYKGSNSFYHAAIYIGDNKIINANRGYGETVIQSLSDYKGNRIVFRRLIETN